MPEKEQANFIIRYNINKELNEDFLKIIEKLKDIDFEDKENCIKTLEKIQNKGKKIVRKHQTTNNFTKERPVTKEYKNIVNKFKKEGKDIKEFDKDTSSLIGASGLLRYYIKEKDLKNGVKSRFIALDDYLINLFEKVKGKDTKKSIDILFKENNEKYVEEKDKYGSKFITQGQISSLASNYLLK